MRKITSGIEQAEFDHTHSAESHWSYEQLLNALAARKDAPALIQVHDNALKSMTGADLASRARALACALLRMGLSSGDPILLIGPNCFSWVVARLALGAAGALGVPVDDASSDDALRDVLARCKAKWAICDSSCTSRLRVLAPQLIIIQFGDGSTGESLYSMNDLSCGPIERLPKTAPDKPEMLAYTSGTTGSPKAIVLTHANIAANIEPLVASGLVGRDDRILLPLPLAHVYPYVVGLLAGLASGAAIVFPQSQTGQHIVAAAGRAEATVMIGVPRLYTAICSGVTARLKDAGFLRRTLFQILLAASIRLRRTTSLNLGRFFFPSLRERFGNKLRLLVSGGARMDQATLWTLIGLGFEIRSGYGLAETASMFTGNLPGATRWGSEGKALVGEMRLSSPDSSGIGEIELRGPQVFSRYLDNVDATRAAFTPDSWFRTGDLGRIDSDGFLYVTERARDVLVLGGGKKVNPEELEKLYGDTPCIQEMAILENHGALVALIVPALEAARKGALHVETAIRVHLASRAQELPSFMRLAGFAITREPLPRTRLGKYRRFLLPQLYERALHPARPQSVHLSEDDKALLQRPLPRKVYEILSKRYPGGPIALDTSPLLDLGIDSLEWIALSLVLEDSLNIRLGADDTASVITVRDLLLAAERASSASQSKMTGPDWTSPTGVLLRILGIVIYALDWIVMRTAFRLRSDGLENLPTGGNFLLIANHTSFLDAPALAAALSRNVLSRTYWAGDALLLFSKPWQAPLMRAIHCYPLDEKQPAQALATSAALLARGSNVIWFPEGWRSPDGSLQEFLPGIGHLLKRQPVAVVPTRIDGAFEAWPRHRRFPRRRPIHVTFGKPIDPSIWKNATHNEEDLPAKIVALLRKAVVQPER